MLLKYNLESLSKKLKKREFTSYELVLFYLNRIKKLDHKLNSFITVLEDYALKKAKEADKLIQSGLSKKFTGIPIAHKDIFCTKDIRTTCGSKMLENFFPPYNATIVEKLNDQGFITLGKTNLDEFCMGSTSENSYYGYIRNPWNKKKVSGGSSGGSAAAVASRLIPIATGSDTGGSIRQPSSFCNVSGLKPTYGRISRYGLIAFSSSLDQAGIISNDIKDIAHIMNIISGHDIKDSTSLKNKFLDFTKNINKSIKNIKIGIPDKYFSKYVDPNVQKILYESLKNLENLGAKLVNIKLPNTKLSVPCYYIISSAECSSNLSKFDGIRYGISPNKEISNLDEIYMKVRSTGFGNEVKKRILIGTYILSSKNFSSLYEKAFKIRQLIFKDFKEIFKKIDIIASPSTLGVAFDKNMNLNSIDMYHSDLFNVSVNLVGLPAISIPAGFFKKNPIGLQLIGNHLDEHRILNVAYKFQNLISINKKIPKSFL